MGIYGRRSSVARSGQGLRCGLRYSKALILVSVWACLWMTVPALQATPVSAADGVAEPPEYDFSVSKGLYLFSARQYSEAERYLSDAVNARPGDPQAGYYLGQTLLRLGRYDAAEERYREILRRHPGDARARMGLGMALYHQDRYSDALTNLSAAETDLPNEPLLYYYEGLAAAALRSFPLANEKFLRAGVLDPELGRDSQYRRGSSLHAQGKPEQATDAFRAAVLTDAPREKPVATSLDDGAPSPQKRWNAQAALSLQYDSNVILLPAGASTPGNNISHKDDFVTVLNGGGEYRFIQNETWTAGAGYGFYQNIHARLSDFNVQDHTPTLYVQRQFGQAQLRLQYILDYVTVGSDPYLLSNAVQPVLTIAESERTFTQAFVRYQRKDFKTFRDNQLGQPVNQTRDANNWMVGAMQYLVFQENRGHVRGGYTFDTDRTGGGDVTQAVPGLASKSDWSYTGHRFSMGVAYQPWPSTKFDLAFDYYRQGYDNPNSFSPTGTTVRKDNVFLITGTAVKDLSSRVWLAFQYSYTRDDANISAFSYVRNVVTFTVGGRF